MISRPFSMRIPPSIWAAFQTARKTTLAGFPSDHAALVGLITTGLLGKSDVSMALDIANAPVRVRDQAHEIIEGAISSGRDPCDELTRLVAAFPASLHSPESLFPDDAEMANRVATAVFKSGGSLTDLLRQGLSAVLSEQPTQNGALRAQRQQGEAA